MITNKNIQILLVYCINITVQKHDKTRLQFYNVIIQDVIL